MTDKDLYFRELEIDTFARTIWGEARGEGSIGMQAVAFVVLNRLNVSKQKGKFWWGNSIIEICRKPYQFSCWNRDDPNCRKLLNIDDRDRTFKKAIEVARHFSCHPGESRDRVDTNAIPAFAGMTQTLNSDPTHGATHYHAIGIYPFWSRDQTPTATIGRHIFYRILT